jgi:outer membrane protein OmpA-like peptidoglycan-associated protein
MKKLSFLILIGIPCLCLSQITIHRPFSGEPLFCKDPACKRKIQVARQQRKNKKKHKRLAFSAPSLRTPRSGPQRDTLPPLSLVQIEADSVVAESDTVCILFGFNTYLLDSAANSTLATVLERLQDRSLTDIQLIGHTDSSGSLLYNINLSELRVKSVREYLIQNGIPAEIIRIEFMAYTKPLHTQDRHLHRRVEMVFK